MTKQKTTPVVALAFPSMNPVPARRRMESKARAQRFGEARSLGESSLVAKDTFGYVVEAGSSVQFMSDASQAGARIVPFREADGATSQGATGAEMRSGSTPGKAGGYPGRPEAQGKTEPEMTTGGTPGKSGGYPGGETSHGKTDVQGVEKAGVESKSTDDAKTHSAQAKAKNKAGDYGASKDDSKARGLKEGEWVKLGEAVEAARIEMSGTQPIGEAVKGMIHPGSYFVLGIEEAKDGAVVTLGKVSTIGDIGSKEEGRYLYNVDAGALAEACGIVEHDDDPSKAGEPGEGGILASAKKTIAKAKAMKGYGGKKKEGIIGASAGTSQQRQRESFVPRVQVTTEAVHSRGVKIAHALRWMDNKDVVAPQPKTTAGRQLVTENAGEAGKPTTKAVSYEQAPRTSGKVAEILEASVSGAAAGGQLTGGPFDQPLDPNLENTLAQFRTGMQANAHMMHQKGINSEILTESQLQDSMDSGSVDPLAFAQRQQLGLMLHAEGIDINNLSEEEIVELLREMDGEGDTIEEMKKCDKCGHKCEGPKCSKCGHKMEGDEEPTGGTLFEDLEPGDVTKIGGVAALLKSRGYANAEKIASHLEAGDAANEWFGLTGGSLQDAKRLQWLHVQAGQKGHF